MSNLRISGLASGMDTDAIVESLMKVERLKVDRYEQNKQVALWRQEQYNNVNKMFANFILNTRRDIGLNKVGITGSIFNTSYNNLDYIRSATSSNEAAATVSSTSQAVNGSFNIEVKQLAKGATFTSAKLDDNILAGKKELSFIVGETEVNVGDGEKDITMDDVVKAINSQASSVATAFYDKGNKRLFIQTNKTGEGVAVGLAAKSGDSNSQNFIDDLKKGIKEQGAAGEDHTGAVYTIGKDAEILFNGVKLTYSSNNINLNGLNIELQSTGTTTIRVETNVQGIYDKIEKLVNDYNELIDKASSLLGEKRYPSHHPLSMEEKKAMHEDDVKLWEEKAKSGMLSNDETINRTLQSMRRYLYEKVETGGSFNQITQIGISTERYARGTTGGKLQIDKEKLMKAITEDPEGVMELLFREPDYKSISELEGKSSLTNERELSGAQITAKRNNSGIFTRIYDELIAGMQNIIDKSGSGENADLYRSVKSNILLDFVTNKSSISDIDKDVLNMNKRIDDLNAMLIRKENAYYAKFANMEKMLQQMYSQSNWLAQQFMY